jgi:autotransporter passenger strand-loop-strand repeat protein
MAESIGRDGADTTAFSGGSLVLSSGGLADPTTIYTGGSGAVYPKVLTETGSIID